MKYMIHSCNQRQWYVDDFLIPSMIEQGIHEEEIIVYQDVNELGNLKAFIKSLRYLDNNDTTWHIQDDVVLSKYFRERTENLTRGVICGFSSRYDDYKKGGVVTVDKMWYSFPCIHIPNNLAKEFVNWFFENASSYEHHLREGKHDDLIFKDFLKAKHPMIQVTHLLPNIVNHIDYLLGGSIVNPNRAQGNAVSLFWKNDGTVEDLERSLRTYGR